MVRHDLQTPEDEVLINAEFGVALSALDRRLTRRALAGCGYANAWCAPRWVIALYRQRWTFAEGVVDDAFFCAVMLYAREHPAWRDALLAVIALAEATFCATLPAANTSEAKLGLGLVARAVAQWLRDNPPEYVSRGC